MLLKNIIVSVSLLVIISSITIYSQNKDAVYSQEKDTVKSATADDSIFVMAKSPWGAVARSAILPGWGQIYNQSYYKAPIIWAVSGWLVYNWIYNNNKDKTYRYKNVRDPFFYRDQRDLFTIYMGLTYMLNLVDAYVDAQLFDFSVDENKLLGGFNINLNIRF